MPAKAQCDSLVWAYMRGYHPLNPVFHGPSFLREVADFQQWRDGPSPDYILNIHFVAVLMATMLGGVVVCPRSELRVVFGGQSRETLSSRFYNQAISAIRISNFPQSPSLQSLAAYLIVNTTWLREEQPLACCAFVGVAIRAAQMLGLHREPTKFHVLTPIEVAVRPILWWSLVAADTQLAYASGLPTLVECSLYDVQPIGKLGDDGLGEPMWSHMTPDETIWRIFTRGKCHFYQNSGELLRLFHNSVLSTQVLDQVLEIARRIRSDLEACTAEIVAIDLSLHRMAEHDHQEEQQTLRQMQSSATLARFCNTLLSMFAARPYPVMYRPLQRHKLLPYLREKESNALMSCRYYLHQFLLLTQCHEFQLWHWCWPGQHQPLHCIMALIMEVDAFPTGSVARETRKLVDLALSMCGQDAGNSGITSTENSVPIPRPLHDGGHEVWKFIRRARDRCWEKAGLDPSVLTCPANASEIYFDGLPMHPLMPTGLHLDSTAGPLLFGVEEWSFFPDFVDSGLTSY